MSTNISPDDIVFDNSYTLTGSGYTISLSGSNNGIVAMDAILGSSTIDANVAFGSNVVDLEAASGASINLSGPVSGSASGAVDVGDKGSNGTIDLSGSNSLSGSVMVFDGTLEANNNNALGTGGMDVFSGEDQAGSGYGVLELGSGVTVSGDPLYGITGTLEASGGTATWAGPVTPGYVGGTATFAAATGSVLDISGAISESSGGTSVDVGLTGMTGMV